MDSFESLVSMLLERDGYWVRSSYKVDITKQEKRDIGRPSSPRWELDLVAYKGATNEILVVECKSYLDSKGVRYGGFDGSDPVSANRYKIFNDDKLRKVIFHRLVSQLQESGSCAPSPSVRLALAAGKVTNEKERTKLKAHFENHHWLLLEDEWFRERLLAVSKIGYENEVAVVVAKLMVRIMNNSPTPA